MKNSEKSMKLYHDLENESIKIQYLVEDHRHQEIEIKSS